MAAVGAAFMAVSFAAASTPASAEVGASVSIFSDARFRGFSISDNHPVALLDLSYDDTSGAYFAASGTAVASSTGVHPLAATLNAGYARRLHSGLTLDAGIVQTRYSHYSSAVSGRSYTEAYAGVIWESFSARIYASPHYFETRGASLYGELENSLGIAPRLRLNGHAGLLVPLGDRNGSNPRPIYDWRIGLSRQSARVSCSVAWTGRGRVRRYDGGYTHSTNAVVLGISYAF